MNQRIITLMATLVAIIPFALFAAPSASAGTNPPAIYLTPHQDDETLSFGPDIRASLEAGRNVIVVLLTDGSESGVCYDRYGDPNLTTAQERTNGGLSSSARAQCTAARDAEFTNALNKVAQSTASYGGSMTIDIRSDRKQDSCSDQSIAATSNSCNSAKTLTPAYAESVAESYLATYPTASLKAQTYHESDHCGGCGNSGPGHPDHDAVGEGLKLAHLSNGSVPTDKRYFVKPELWQYKTTWSATTNVHKNINGMLQAYENIGWYSVPCDFWEQIYDNTTLVSNSSGDSPGTLCTGYTRQTTGGADSYYHIPGK